MRQKYQEKIIDSRAQNEPRKIFDIVNSVGGNSINSTTRTSISVLSDTSGILKIFFETLRYAKLVNFGLF